MGRRVFAASLAALAEAGLAFLIVAEVAAEGANATVGPLLIYPLFLALFVGGVVLGLRLRGIRAYAAGALGVGVALALLQGLAWGHGDVLGVSLLVVVIAFAASRTVTLVRRDWSEPVAGSFLGGSAVLLLEVALAASSTCPRTASSTCCTSTWRACGRSPSGCTTSPCTLRAAGAAGRTGSFGWPGSRSWLASAICSRERPADGCGSCSASTPRPTSR